MVEHSTADREVPGSNPGVPLPFTTSKDSDSIRSSNSSSSSTNSSSSSCIYKRVFDGKKQFDCQLITFVSWLGNWTPHCVWVWTAVRFWQPSSNALVCLLYSLDLKTTKISKHFTLSYTCWPLKYSGVFSISQNEFVMKAIYRYNW